MRPTLPTFFDVEAAAQRINGRIERTPYLFSRTLSELTGAEIWLKFENLQFTAAFKERGALNRLLLLEPAERARGVMAVSAGNHAQGVACHASRLGIASTIIMPRPTPAIKARRTRQMGGEVILEGDNFAQAMELATRLANERDLLFVHPYDDPQVIAGQGTVALEMLADGARPDVVVVAVGGGGLLGGMGLVYEALAPGTEIIGVQSEHYPSMAHALGYWPTPAAGGRTNAEGIAVTEPGALTRTLAADFVDGIIVVPEWRIEQAIALLLDIEKSLVEGAGAAGLAAVLHQPDQFRGKRVGLVLCGGNIDTRDLVAILQRQLVRDGRLLRFRLALSDQAGVLAEVAHEIAQHGGNINRIEHDRGNEHQLARTADVSFEVEFADPESGLAFRHGLAKLGLTPYNV